MGEPRKALVVLACDLIEGGSRVGEDTLYRCITGAETTAQMHLRGEYPAIVLSAGMADRQKYPQQIESLALMMYPHITDHLHYLMGIQARWVKIHRGEPGWGTKHEIREGLLYLKACGSTEPLHVVTSWYHVWRVKMIARLAFGEEVVVHKAKGKWSGFWWEILKLPIQYVVLRLSRPEILRPTLVRS